MIDGECTFADNANYKPLFHLIENVENLHEKEFAEWLMDMHENGRISLLHALPENRKNMESLWKTYLYRVLTEDEEYCDKAFLRDSLGLMHLKNKPEEVIAIRDFVANCLIYIEEDTVCCGQCDNCGTFYPIYRGKDKKMYLAKNRWCPKCRHSILGQISKSRNSTKYNNPIYKAYEKLYNRFYRWKKQSGKISEKEFKEYIKIAADIRNRYLEEDNQDAAQYEQEVLTQIEKEKIIISHLE